VAQKLSTTHIALGRRIRQLRVERGLTQETLGFEAGLHRTYVGHVERGEKNVSAMNLFKLADGLGVDPQELFSGVKVDGAEVRSFPPDED
jgi:transcriptional regulator with XRE-family HTH domain